MDDTAPVVEGWDSALVRYRLHDVSTVKGHSSIVVYWRVHANAPYPEVYTSVRTPSVIGVNGETVTAAITLSEGALIPIDIESQGTKTRSKLSIQSLTRARCAGGHIRATLNADPTVRTAMTTSAAYAWIVRPSVSDTSQPALISASIAKRRSALNMLITRKVAVETEVASGIELELVPMAKGTTVELTPIELASYHSDYGMLLIRAIQHNFPGPITVDDTFNTSALYFSVHTPNQVKSISFDHSVYGFGEDVVLLLSCNTPNVKLINIQALPPTEQMEFTITVEATPVALSDTTVLVLETPLLYIGAIYMDVDYGRIDTLYDMPVTELQATTVGTVQYQFTFTIPGSYYFQGVETLKRLLFAGVIVTGTNCTVIETTMAYAKTSATEAPVCVMRVDNILPEVAVVLETNLHYDGVPANEQSVNGELSAQSLAAAAESVVSTITLNEWQRLTY